MTKAELMAKCERIGLPFAPITKPHELFDDIHLQQSEGLMDITLPDGELTKVPALPLTIDGRRLGVRRDLPKIGQHSFDILSETGFSAEEIESMVQSGIVLSAT